MEGGGRGEGGEVREGGGGMGEGRRKKGGGEGGGRKGGGEGEGGGRRRKGGGEGGGRKGGGERGGRRREEGEEERDLRPFHTGTQCALNAHSMRIGRFHIQCALEPMRIQSGLNPLPRNPLPEVV